MALISYREKATRIAEQEAANKVREVGGNNRGPRVQEYQRATWLGGTGWSWCCAFVVWCFKQAGKHDIRPTAGVPDFLNFYSHARVERPYRGDCVCYDWDGDGVYDHIGFVSRVLSIRILGKWYLKTVEGNTGSGEAGNQSDGGGVFVRRRLVSRKQVAFVRLSGVTSDDV